MLPIILVSLFIGFSSLQDKPKEIQNFTLTNAVDGSSFSLVQLNDAKAVVVIFTSNYCPFAKLYDRRISDLIDMYQQQGVKFVLINPNNPKLSPADSPEKMAQKVKDFRWNVPYLIDPKQEVASLFDAHKTPEAFVLQQKGGKFTVLYRGAIDDNPQVAADVAHSYLRDALDAVLKNKPVSVADTHPTGCMIKH